MRLPVWPNLLPNISFLMRSVGSIETIMTRTPGTLWDPIRLQGVSGLIGKRLPADHNQIGAASINLSPTPFASITIISHILWISVSSLPTRPSTLSRLTLNISWTSPTWSEVTTWRRCSGPTICICGREFILSGLRF